MGVDELVAVLEKVDLFHDLRPRVLRRIAEAGREETFAAGDPVIVQGEEVSGFRSFSPSKNIEVRGATPTLVMVWRGNRVAVTSRVVSFDG